MSFEKVFILSLGQCQTVHLPSPDLLQEGWKQGDYCYCLAITFYLSTSLCYCTFSMHFIYLNVCLFKTADSILATLITISLSIKWLFIQRFYFQTVGRAGICRPKNDCLGFCSYDYLHW